MIKKPLLISGICIVIFFVLMTVAMTTFPIPYAYFEFFYSDLGRNTVSSNSNQISKILFNFGIISLVIAIGIFFTIQRLFIMKNNLLKNNNIFRIINILYFLGVVASIGVLSISLDMDEGLHNLFANIMYISFGIDFIISNFVFSRLHVYHPFNIYLNYIMGIIGALTFTSFIYIDLQPIAQKLFLFALVAYFLANSYNLIELSDNTKVVD